MAETRYSSRIPLLVFLPVLVVIVIWFLPGGHFQYKEQREGEFPLPAATKRVVVRVDKGHVRVMAGGGTEIVRFRARSLRAAGDKEALEVLRAQDLTLNAEFVEASGELVLSTPPFPAGLEVAHEFPTKEGGRVVRKGSRGMREFDVNLEVPSHMPVSVDCGLGNVTIEHLGVPVDVHTGGGTVHLKMVTADTRVRAGQGDVVVDQHRGGLDILTDNGRVLVLMSEVLKPATLRTLAGDVKCTVPRKASFDLDARSLSGGGIVSDFDLPRFPIGKEGRKMQGKVNKGGPLLRAQSDKGTVSVLVGR
jgi:Toastrack DUF4097